MGTALISGLKNEKSFRINAAEATVSLAAKARARLGIPCTADPGTAASKADIVVLCVKPDKIKIVCRAIADDLAPGALVISIAAGITCRVIEESFAGKTRVIRAMPNTPGLIGQGMTAICPGAFAKKTDLAVAEKLFESIGKVVRTSEKHFNAITALSGSGPAFVFEFILGLSDGAVAQGLPRALAAEMALRTVAGAALLAEKTGEHPAQLTEKVASPGGTTIEGMQVLHDAGFRGTVMEAVRTAASRAEELMGD